MMHVDKNADGHVLDVDRISREIAYVSLMEGSGLNIIHACRLFFLEKKIEYKTCLPVV